MTRDRRRDLILALESFAKDREDAPPLEERPYFRALVESPAYRGYLAGLVRNGEAEAPEAAVPNTEACRRWRARNPEYYHRRRADPDYRAAQAERMRRKRRTPPC